MWQITEAKYIGAAMGLSVGNLIKFPLDERALRISEVGL
jgi:hypothetical protein